MSRLLTLPRATWLVSGCIRHLDAYDAACAKIFSLMLKGLEKD